MPQMVPDAPPHLACCSASRLRASAAAEQGARARARHGAATRGVCGPGGRRVRSARRGRRQQGRQPLPARAGRPCGALGRRGEEGCLSGPGVSQPPLATVLRHTLGTGVKPCWARPRGSSSVAHPARLRGSSRTRRPAACTCLAGWASHWHGWLVRESRHAVEACGMGLGRCPAKACQAQQDPNGPLEVGHGALDCHWAAVL